MGWNHQLGLLYRYIYPKKAPWRLEYLLTFGLNLTVNAGKYSIPVEHMDTDIYRKGFLNHAEGFNNFLVMLQGGLCIQKPDFFRHGAHMNPKNNTRPWKWTAGTHKSPNRKGKLSSKSLRLGSNFQGSYLDLRERRNKLDNFPWTTKTPEISWWLRKSFPIVVGEAFKRQQVSCPFGGIDSEKTP